MPKLVGQSFKRVEDPRLITGEGRYVDDVQLPRMCYAAILRSPYAHARIRHIDVSKALQTPGVVTVITGKDILGKIGPLPCAAHPVPEMKMPTHYALAVNKVYFVGHPVAVVVAEDRYLARDALDLIEVDYEELPPVTDPQKALQPDAPIIHEDLGTNLAFEWKIEGGDVDAAFAQAEVIVRQDFVNQRLIPVPMEPRCVLAEWDAGNRLLTIWTSTQIPHLVRSLVAGMLNLPENHVRVIAPDVGGGFGQKLQVYVEEALMGYLAMTLDRPVKWTETRRENFMASIQGRDQIGVMELALKRDGTILGLRYDVIADMGAYYQLLTPAIPTLTGLMLCGAYKIPAVRMTKKAVFTNKMCTDAYRGAGRPEATFLLERMMDLAAKELGMDPAEIRRKNFIPPDAFPYTTPHGITYDSGNYEAALNRALELVEYEKWRKEQQEARKQGRYIGIGISSYVEICGMGPSKAMPAGGWESATVRVEPSGKVIVLTGAHPHGQGEETSFTQIVAEELGVAPEDVMVIHGDTEKVQYGIGIFGSRGLAVGGTAVYMAAQRVKEKARKIAAFLLNVSEAEVEARDGTFVKRNDPSKFVTWQQIAQAAYDPKNYPPDMEPGLVATAFYEPSNFTFPSGTHICVCEVDIETGEVKILRYVAVDDCGKVVNPLLVEGQIIGGIVQAFGQAMMERCVYDENGQLLTGELLDYAIPKAHNAPKILVDRVETPSPVNPLGAKGVGEAGTIGATPAFINAVCDALEPLGIRHIDMPLTPARVWHAIQKAQKP
ncbi:MAG: glyceraldehyde dehydrogenase subunit alpha [Armatimonadota bacterium]|nr:glyceraldehyde dehydrogenase subunit alpha [Armatimonadota bacterium]